MAEAPWRATRNESRTVIQTIVARGYQPESEPHIGVRWVAANHSLRDRVNATLSSHHKNTIFVLSPTYLGRFALSSHVAHVQNVLGQLEHALRSFPDLGVVFLVGMQWFPLDDTEQEAVDRLRILSAVAERVSRVPFIGMALRGPGKNRTINAAIHAIGPATPRAWLWIDDDVRLEDGCVEALINRFVAQPSRRAVGATIIPVGEAYASSRWLRRVGKITAPPKPYPTACCMLVDGVVVRHGIPARCFVDDAFVLFELIDPARVDPLEELEVVAEARVYHPAGGRALATLTQLRRRLYSHVIYCAEYPAAVAHCYLRSCLFFGLWPLSDFDRSHGIFRGAVRWWIKALHLSLFLAAAANLFVRGVLKRPMRSIRWGTSHMH